MVTPSEGPKPPAPGDVVIPVAPRYRFVQVVARLCQVSGQAGDRTLAAGVRRNSIIQNTLYAYAPRSHSGNVLCNVERFSKSGLTCE